MGILDIFKQTPISERIVEANALFEKGDVEKAREILFKSKPKSFDDFYSVAKTEMSFGWEDDANRTMQALLTNVKTWDDNVKRWRLIESVSKKFAEIVGKSEAMDAIDVICTGHWDRHHGIQGVNEAKSISKQSPKKIKSIDGTALSEKTIDQNDDFSYNVDIPKISKISKQINILRGFEIIGGTFAYKVKILNNTPSRINDIKIQIISYPNDCLKADTTERTVSKVEPNGGFRSLEFKFTPTHDCVQGVVNSLVTYIDSTETLQTQVVEPIVIKSVCDLLKPLEGSKYEILDIIDKLKAGAQDEITINASASEMFQRFLDVLPDRNFAITDSDSKELGGRFMGNITAAARGKYTNENIGLKITVLDNGDGGCTVHFKACGNDSSMLPTAVEEVKQILDTKALLVMNIMRTLNVIRGACRVDTAHSVLTKLEELKVKIDGEVEVSAVEKLDNVMGCEVMYDSVEERLKEHDVKKICVYCDHLEGMLEVGLVKK